MTESIINKKIWIKLTTQTCDASPSSGPIANDQTRALQSQESNLQKCRVLERLYHCQSWRGLVPHKTERTSASDQLAKLPTSCGVGALQKYVICVSFLFWPIAPSLPIISARSRRRFTARVRQGRNAAHEALVPASPVFARVATRTAPHTSPGSLCIFGISFHRLSLEASF